MAALRNAVQNQQAVNDTAVCETGDLVIDVMFNDRGGQARTLYAVRGTETGQAGISAYSRYGALVTIESGKVRYDPGASATIDALAAGEKLQDSFQYAVRMGNGTWSWASAQVTVTGSNDAATIVGMASGALGEDAAGSVAGTLRVLDVDRGENGFGAVGALTGHWGSFRFDAGDWSYALDAASTQALAAGEQVQDTLSVSSLDGTATQQIVVTITGENDAPVVISETTVVAGEIAELPDGSPGESTAVHSARGAIAFADVDRGDSFSASAGAAPQGYLGTFSLAPLQGQDGAVSWTFTVDDQEIEALDAGEEIVQTYEVQIADAHGGVATQQVNVTLRGAEDAASIVGTASGALREDGPGTTGGTLRVDDADRGENGFGAIGALAGRWGSFRFDAGDWSYALDAPSTQALAAGEQVQDTLRVTSLDGSATQDIVVTITGENDAPVVISEISVVAGQVAELADRSPGENSTVHSARGTIAFADVDRGDGASASVAGAPAGYLGTLSLAPPDGQEGAVSWVFTVDDKQLDALAAGEERVQTYEVQIADAHGGIATQQVQVTLRGAADATSQPTPDLFVATQAGAQHYALLNLRDGNGDQVIDGGTMLPLSPMGSYGIAVAADFDGDGRTDVARSDNSSGQGVRLFLNRDADANGVPELMPLLLPAGTGLVEASGLAAGDVNGDGRADLFLGTPAQDILFLGVGDTNGDTLPEFRRVDLPRMNSYSYAVGIGDLDGDGRADLIAGGWLDRTYIAFNRGDANGDGVPEFAYDGNGPGSGSGMGQLTLADVNGDGRLDFLATSAYTASSHGLFINRGDRNGDGQLDFDRIALASGGSARDGTLADIDRDGDLDALVFETNQTRIFSNRGDSNGDGLPEFLAPVIVAGQPSLGGSAGDIDADGDADFVRALYLGTGVEVATNRGDLNGDGAVDWSVTVVGVRSAVDALLLDL